MSGVSQGMKQAALAAPTSRLAVCYRYNPRTVTALGGDEGGSFPTNGNPYQSSRPALLVSFVYLRPFLKIQRELSYRDWVMDSGAFSVRHSGATIDLQQYIDTVKALQATDPTLTEVFALDVIGDWRAGLRNTEEMWRQGVRAIPCFHCGEPEDVLRGIARDYPKIAVGNPPLKGPKKIHWALQCLSRVWPKPVHGFGFGGAAVLDVPFHSTDATNWEAGPTRFGNWQSLPGLSWRGGKQDIRGEVLHHLKIEAEARRKWRADMITLEDMLANDPRWTGGSPCG